MIDIKVVESNTTIDVKSDTTDKIATSVSDNTQLTAELNEPNKVDAQLSVNSLNLDADIGEVQVISESINDYETLLNRPKINGTVLSGNKTSEDLGLADRSHNHDDRYYTETETDTLLNSKVDVEEGKGLSTNDFTNAEKTKLANLENYELPTASNTQLGGVKVGEGLSITNGVLSATGGGEAESVQWTNVLNKPSTFPPSSHTHTKSEITDFPTLATVATSGSYNDLTNKPTIPTVDSTLSATSTNAVQNKVVKTALDTKANSNHTHDDRYYTEEEIDSKLSGKSDVGHNHDERYYGKTDVDDKLSEKADLVHTHTKADITDFAHNHDERYYTEEEIDTKLSGIGGIAVTELWSGSLSANASSSTVYTIANGATYKIIVLLMSIASNSSMTPLTIPISAFGTSQSSNYAKWTNADDAAYATYAMWISGNDLKFSGWAGNGKLTYIYGIK